MTIRSTAFRVRFVTQTSIKSLFVLCMMVSPLFVALTAQAVTFSNDYPDTDAAGNNCSNQFGTYSWCKEENGISGYQDGEQNSSRNFGYVNCTDGAAYWVKKYTGVTIPSSWSNAKNWDDAAVGYAVKPGAANDIEPGDIAQSDDGEFGHVGFVTSVVKTNGVVTSITTAELNASGTGAYTAPTYTSKNVDSKFIRPGTNRDWDHFIDINGLGLGLNNENLNTVSDSDSDGVADSSDFCPQVPGNNTNGCPWVDMNIDANGDGSDDLVHMWSGGINTLLSNGNGTYNLVGEGYKPYPTYGMSGGRWLSGNFNNDQNTDLIHIWSGGVNTWFSNGDGTYTVVENAKPVSNYNMNDGFRWEVADVGGDGKDELLHLWSGGVNTWFSNGDGTYTMPSTYIPRSGYDMGASGNWYFANVGGSDKVDLIQILGSGVNTLLSNGDGTYNLVREGYKPFPNYGMTGGFLWKLADVTGDSKADILYFWYGGVDTWMSNGDGTYSFATYIPRAGYGMTGGAWYFGDVNDDSKIDLLHQWTGGVNTWLSNGDGTYSLVGEGAKPVSNYNMNDGFKWQVNDMDGDGKDELLHLWSGGINTWISGGNGTYTMPSTYIPRAGYGMTGGVWY